VTHSFIEAQNIHPPISIEVEEIDDLSAALAAEDVHTDLFIAQEAAPTENSYAQRQTVADTNATMILEIRAGNITAIEAFCEMFRPYIRRYASSMSRKLTLQDLEDLSQEVLAVAMAKLGNFRGESQLRTWVIGITRNILLDRLRKMRRQDMHEVAIADLAVVLETEGTTPEGNPEQTAMDRADAEQLHRALKLVSPQLREILILRYVRELSLREIAETTGESRSKVERKLAKAKRQVGAVIDL
jgi:RNA polymerase sigma factor (sigma-70 family)